MKSMKRSGIFTIFAVLMVFASLAPVWAQSSRGPEELVTLKASGAVTNGTTLHSAVTRLWNFKEAIFFFDVTAVSASVSGNLPDRLDVYIQTSPDNSTWQDVVRFAQITTATASRVAQWSSRVATSTAWQSFEYARDFTAMAQGAKQIPAGYYWRAVSAASAATANPSSWTYTLIGYFRE